MTYPNKLEPWVIQQQQNQTKNNLLVLMGLVLSLPRTFQPGSRDRSGGGGEGDDNEAKLFLRLQMSELSVVPLAGPGAAAGPWRCRGEAEHPRSTARDRHFPFPGLHYFLEREPRWPGREGLRFPACLFARPCVLLPGEERSQAGRGKLGCVAVVWLGGWEPGSPMCQGGSAALAPSWSHPCFQGVTRVGHGGDLPDRGLAAVPNSAGNGQCRQLSGSQVLQESARHVGVEGAQDSCKKVLVLPPGRTPHGSVLHVLLIPAPPARSPAQGTAFPHSVFYLCWITLLHRVGDTAWAWESIPAGKGCCSPGVLCQS